MLVTRQLVNHILNTNFEDIPAEVREHGMKSILNWMGVAIGAAEHPSVNMVLSLKDELEGNEQVSIFGRAEKCDLLLATLINGMTSHIFVGYKR